MTRSRGIDLAIKYLETESLGDEQSNLKLRFYRGDFYRYSDGCYLKISDSEMRAGAMRFLQSYFEEMTTIHNANNVIANLQGKALVPSNLDLPILCGTTFERSENFISMRNGILDLNLLLAGQDKPMREHTPKFFSTISLPYNYDLHAKCPQWTRFLSEMLPDNERRMFLQEWFGYNLVYDTTYQTFVILFGEGANGKTVVCVVLRALLGFENVSSVGLEQFNPARTFPIASTIGKLANIVEELSEIDKVAEGILKDYISGGRITVEHKNKQPFVATPTARLTFATNVLPRFRDRSDALWRRMMPLPFDVQIIDPTKQDKNLVNPVWWERSGELPAIFNWALQGLIRLREQKRFTDPKVCVDLRLDFRRDANPAAQFLEDYCKKGSGAEIASNVLYRRYSEWMKQRNAKALGEAQFSPIVRRAYPGVSLSTNPRRQSDGTRSRVWTNLDWIDEGAANSLDKLWDK